MDEKDIDKLLKGHTWIGRGGDPNNGKIYKVWTPSSNKVYIGSTCHPLAERFKDHVRNYYRWKKAMKRGDKKYKGIISYKILDMGPAQITLVENYKCNTLQELRRREGNVIRATPNTVNQTLPGRTYKEWVADKKQEDIKLMQSQSIEHREDHQTTILSLMQDLRMMDSF